MSETYPFPAEKLNALSQGSMVSHLGIEFTALGPSFLEAEMPVDERTMQPFGILHGGATMALAETVGSGLSVAHLNPQEYAIKGLEINGNHLKSVDKGKVTARATYLHRGKNTHVVEIKMWDEEGELTAVARITNFIKKLEEGE